MLGILLSYWGGLFSGAFAGSFRECICWDALVCFSKSLVKVADKNVEVKVKADKYLHLCS